MFDMVSHSAGGYTSCVISRAILVFSWPDRRLRHDVELPVLLDVGEAERELGAHVDARRPRGLPRGTTTLRADVSRQPPNTFIAATFGSLKKMGSTCSMMSALTSRKLRLFSMGINARFAPLSRATCNGSVRERMGLMLP